ncbi:MAG: hypothetical protein JJLCMIEE_00322 [Acidimicrobiales bacterium]|nr:hypothetical protein [Acidimicrobiales bacterium]
MALAAICVVLAVRADAQEDDAVAPAGTSTQETAAPVTPVLSARRVPRVVAAPVGDQALRTDLDAIVASSPADSCLSVQRSGETVIDHRSDSALVPASNQKLVTGAAALIQLGPDHVLTTDVSAATPPVNGVISGDLYFVGGGDPLLATDDYIAVFESQPQIHSDMEALADAVVAAGVTRVEGSVVGDESRYDAMRAVPSWPERYAEQNASGPLSALSVNDGFASYRKVSLMELDVTASEDPALEAAAVLTGLLRERGVEIVGEPLSGVAPPGATVVASLESQTISEIVHEMNSESDNTTAELLLKEIGLARRGEGTTTAGAAAVPEILAEAGLPVNGLVVADGSGLDTGNRVSCDLLLGILLADGAEGPLSSNLSVAGQSGTLAERFVGTPAEGRLTAKTGSLNEVTALSGWVLSEGGQNIAFAYVVNVPDGASVSGEDLALQTELGVALALWPEGIDVEALAPVSMPEAAED